MAKKVSVGVQIDGSAKGFKAAAEEAAQATQKLRQRVNKDTGGMANAFKNLAKTIGLAFVVRKVVDFGKELIGIGSKAEGVRAAFDRLNAPDLLKNLRKATRGAVDDVTLMTQAIQATNRGVDINMLATAFKFATNRAIDTGAAVNDLVADIVNGLGTGSVKVLDNLGLSQQELIKRTKTLGSTTAAAASMMNEALEASGEIADTSSIRIDRLTVAWGNFKAGLGDKLVSSNFFSDFIGGIEKIAKLLETAPNPYEGFTAEQVAAEKARLTHNQGQLLFGKEALEQTKAGQPKDVLGQAITNMVKQSGGAELTKDMANNVKNLAENLQALDDLKVWEDYLISVEKAKIAQEAAAAAAKAEADAIQSEADAIAARNKRLEDYLNLLKQKEKKPIPTFAGRGIGETGKNLLRFGYTADPGLDESGAEGLEWIDDLNGAFLQFFSNTEGGFESMAQSFGRALQSMAAQLAAKAAIFGILSALTGGTSTLALNAGKALSNFKWFADGGIVSGPTMGMVGEYPGAKSNPEVVAPLSKLKGMLGEAGGGRIIAEGVVTGRDLKLILRRN